MTRTFDRREFIQLAGLATAGVAGAVFSSGLRGVSLAAEKGKAQDFLFLQMSDLHWGFSGPAVEFRTLRRTGRRRFGEADEPLVHGLHTMDADLPGALALGTLLLAPCQIRGARSVATATGSCD